MFTGIIESMGIVSEIKQDQENFIFTISSPISKELKIDQSVAHNGVCLTVVKCDAHQHSITAIWETMHKTNLGKWKVGDEINLERCMQLNGRLDGHIVQGHVDQVGMLTEIKEEAGSWRMQINYDEQFKNITVEKGSICVNGISLTVVDSGISNFSVAIIPYTFEHTNMKTLKVGDAVNLEFDIIGKYIGKLMDLKK